MFVKFLRMSIYLLFFFHVNAFKIAVFVALSLKLKVFT